MATGTPRGKLSAASTGDWAEVTLEYPGKKPASRILCAPPADLVEVAKGVGAGAKKSRFYFGDNLAVLSSLLTDSELAGRVRLVYIDPPFSTGSVFHSRRSDHAYEDTLTGAVYLEFLRERAVLLRELLAEDGSIYVHLDGKMVFHVKVLLDEIFGAGAFRNCVTRKKCNPKNYTRKQYGNVADYILFYTKSDRYVWNKPVEQWTEERSREYQYVERGSGRRFMKVPIHAPGIRHGETGAPWRGTPPPPGKHWQFPPATLDEMDARGEIFWSSNGNPRRKVYLDESSGVGVQDIWLDHQDAHNQNIRVTGYPTEKNPDLLRRIISASSDPGDLVLDCFSGSGTTLAVAEELGRRWIGIDNSAESFKTLLTRFEHGMQPMGDFVSGQRPLQSSGKAVTAFTIWAERHLAAAASTMAAESGIVRTEGSAKRF